MSLNADKKRWDDLRASLAKAREAMDEFDRQLHAKYGRYETSWLTSPQRKKLEALRSKYDKIGDKIIEMIVRVSPRGDTWLSGVPSHWLRSELTWEDMIRPKGEPLSVVVPGAWGYRDGHMKEKTSGGSRRDLDLRPECKLCGHDRWVIQLNPSYWQCQRHGTEGKYDDNEHVIRARHPSPIKEKVMASRKNSNMPPRGRRLMLQAETAGINYATAQLESDYFREWVAEQTAEADQLRQKDPDSVLPLENIIDARKVARRMLQQLEWDTKKDLLASDIEKQLGIGKTTPDVINAFYAGFHRGVTNPSTVEWLAETVLGTKPD